MTLSTVTQILHHKAKPAVVDGTWSEIVSKQAKKNHNLVFKMAPVATSLFPLTTICLYKILKKLDDKEGTTDKSKLAKHCRVILLSLEEEVLHGAKLELS